MFGWALKKGFQSVTGATDGPEVGDTTQFEGPDTPAPVFAARAIRNAIWGPQAAPQVASGETRPAEEGASTAPAAARSRNIKSPTRPNGILLTPGTGVARRKRVSFGHDVKASANGDVNANGAVTRKKPSLQVALENSRGSRAKKAAQAVEATKPTMDVKARRAQSHPPPATVEDESDEEWEDDLCNQDVTLDLNEPHSTSGKYWKSEFNKYTEDARAEMEKLVKYKNMAKLYAQKKDTEATALSQKLREEQEKVGMLEQKVEELAGRKQGRRSDETDLRKRLAETSALVGQYQAQIEELQRSVKEHEEAGNRPTATSPGTERILLEVHRELNRAQSELKEMEGLRDEVERLRDDLRQERQRTSKLVDENQRLAAEVLQPAERQRSEQQVRQKDKRIKALEEEVKALKAKETWAATSPGFDATLSKHSRIARDLKSDLDSLHKPPADEKGSRLLRPQPRGPVTSTSDMAQTCSAEDVAPNAISEAMEPDWSLLEIERELNQELMQARQRDRERFSNGNETPQAKASMPHPVKAVVSTEKGRMASAIASDPANEASPRPANPRSAGRKMASGRISCVEEEKEGRHEQSNYDMDSPRRRRSAIGRPPRPAKDEPEIDLVRDRFARVGAADSKADATLAANESRTTLPAHRRAAVRARVDQKRLERKMAKELEAGKENVKA